MISTNLHFMSWQSPAKMKWFSIYIAMLTFLPKYTIHFFYKTCANLLYNWTNLSSLREWWTLLPRLMKIFMLLKSSFINIKKNFFLFFVKKTTLIYITLHIILKENLFRVRDSSPLTESYFFPQVYSLPVNEMCDDSCVRELMILSK